MATNIESRADRHRTLWVTVTILILALLAYAAYAAFRYPSGVSMSQDTGSYMENNRTAPVPGVTGTPGPNANPSVSPTTDPTPLPQ